jgi:hypothetical protein
MEHTPPHFYSISTPGLLNRVDVQFYFNLGISALVSDHENTALADELLILEQTKPSHRIIKDLKSHDWHVQNPAIGKLTIATIGKMAKDIKYPWGWTVRHA